MLGTQHLHLGTRQFQQAVCSESLIGRAFLKHTCFQFSFHLGSFPSFGMFLSRASFSLLDAGSPAGSPFRTISEGFLGLNLQQAGLPWELLPPVRPVTGKMLGQGRGPR